MFLFRANLLVLFRAKLRVNHGSGICVGFWYVQLKRWHANLHLFTLWILSSLGWLLALLSFGNSLMKCRKSKELQEIKEYYHSWYLKVWWRVYSIFAITVIILQIVFILFVQIVFILFRVILRINLQPQFHLLHLL